MTIGIYYGRLVNFMAIWCFSPVLVFCVKKNLATLHGYGIPNFPAFLPAYQSNKKVKLNQKKVYEKAISRRQREIGRPFVRKKICLEKINLKLHSSWTPQRLLCRVARFFLVQNTKTGKKYQITTIYTKCP
jgi:hypothetical protein